MPNNLKVGYNIYMLSENLNPKIFDKDCEQIPIRKGLGEGLVIAGEKDSQIVALCADLTESTQMHLFKNKFPERFVEMGVAEQNLASVASGMAAMGKIPVISSYAMFSPGRNWEQIRTTICYNDRKVIIAGSGMSNGGRIVHHEAKYLSDPRNTIIIAGYQAVNTLGRRIVDEEKELIINGQIVELRARVVNIHGFSAHKDSEHLIEFVGTTKDSLKRVCVVLGEPKSTYFLGQRLHEEYMVPVTVPQKGDVIELP